jgi:hypothetical protein
MTLVHVASHPREAILLRHTVIARSRAAATKQSRKEMVSQLTTKHGRLLRFARNDKRNIMEIGETIYVTTREEFRDWLEKNHRIKKEIWLIQYKKVTKKPSIPYVDAVEEAICFGWIDGFEKGMDGDRYATRFTHRRPKSNWTETNKERARRMIAEGKMTEAGRAALPPDVKG